MPIGRLQLRLQMLVYFCQDPCALQSRPRPDGDRTVMNITRCYEPIKSCIDPAVYRHIAGTHVLPLPPVVLFLTFAESSKFGDIRSAVAGVRAGNLASR